MAGSIGRRRFLPSRAVVALLAAAVSSCTCGETTLRVVNGAIRVAPEAIDFGKVAIGTSGTRLVDVRNIGVAPLDIASLTLTDAALSTEGKPQLSLTRILETDCDGKDRAAASRGTLGSGECARFEVRYDPLELAPMAGVVTIGSTDPNQPSFKLPIAGSGAIPRIKVCVLPETGEVDDAACTHFDDPDPTKAAALPELDFGAAPVGETVTRLVRIFNVGDSPLIVSSAQAESDFPDFSLESERFSGTVEPAKTVDVVVQFVPRGDGARTGTLVILDGDVAHSRIELPLKAQAHGPRLCILPEAGLDFGAVPVLESRMLTVKVTNCGFVTFDVTSLAFHQDGQSSSRDFAVTAPNTIPALPKSFSPGDSLDVDLTFKPTAVGPFTGNFSVVTAFDRRVVPVTAVGAPAACVGAARPTAVIKVRKGATDITANPLVQPLDTVIFDGSTSTVPRGSPRYAWRLVSQPQNGTQNVVPRANPSQANLYAPLDGDYVVELVVGDSYGCDSAPAQATLHVKSQGSVHVQLTWAQSFGDLDLHVLGPNGRFGDVSNVGGGSDCFYANCNGRWGDPGYSLDWGLNGTTSANNNHTDDPTLDIDELWGNGPENVTHRAPFDATYSVLVHYYCSREMTGSGFGRESLGPVDATLKVFVNGVQQYSETRRLTQRDKWSPATIAVSNRGTTITVVPSTAAITKSTAEIDACTTDTN